MSRKLLGQLHGNQLPSGRAYIASITSSVLPGSKEHLSEYGWGAVECGIMQPTGPMTSAELAALGCT